MQHLLRIQALKHKIGALATTNSLITAQEKKKQTKNPVQGGMTFVSRICSNGVTRKSICEAVVHFSALEFGAFCVLKCFSGTAETVCTNVFLASAFPSCSVPYSPLFQASMNLPFPASKDGGGCFTHMGPHSSCQLFIVSCLLQEEGSKRRRPKKKRSEAQTGGTANKKPKVEEDKDEKETERERDRETPPPNKKARSSKGKGRDGREKKGSDEDVKEQKQDEEKRKETQKNKAKQQPEVKVEPKVKFDSEMKMEKKMAAAKKKGKDAVKQGEL